MAIHEPKQNTYHALAQATSTKQHIIDHAAQKHSAMDFTVFFKLFSDSEGVKSVSNHRYILASWIRHGLPVSRVRVSHFHQDHYFTGRMCACTRAWHEHKLAYVY